MQAIPTAGLQKAFTRAAQPIAIIGAVGGFIGDIIQPLGDFALWVAGASFLIAVVSLVWIIQLRRRAGQEVWDTIAAGIFVVAVGSFVVFSVWTIVFSLGPERGYLATNVEPIGNLQAQLLGLQQDVTEIKETTADTATRVAEQATPLIAVATNVAQQATPAAASATTVAVAATAQAEGFADIQKKFAELQAGQGTIVSNPQSPQEWYSNARLYQLRGDTANAIKAYEGYFEFNLDFVDPYFEYSDLLKATEGIVRAREKMDAYYNANKTNPTLDLVSARLLDDANARTARYVAITERAPQFGPALYELGAEYTRALGASSTADLLSKQSDAYTKLFELEKSAQGYTRFFIDKSLAEKNLTDAQKTFDAFVQARTVTGKVDVLVYQYNDGMQFIVILSESGVKKLLFDIDNPKPTRDTGMIAVTGTPNTNIGKVPLSVGKHTLYLQYIDANDVPSQIFEKEFEVRQVFATWVQQPIDFSTNLYPGTFQVGVTGAPFEQLFTYKWSVDSDTLDNSVLGVGLFAIPHKGLAAGEHVIYIQAIAQDGSKTYAVEKIPFEVK